MIREMMSHGSTIIVISTITFIGMLCSFFLLDNIFQQILDKANYFITILSLVTAAYSGYGLSRLSIFDKLDDLQENDAVRIEQLASFFRKKLESIVRFSIMCSVILFIFGLIAKYSEHAYIFFGVFLSFTVASIVFLILVMGGIFYSIAELRRQFILLSKTEKKRRELIKQMREQAEKYPLGDMDLHFRKQKNVIGSSLK